MYVPKAFAERDPAAQIAFVQAHPFGVLVSAQRKTPLATHAPFVVLERDPPVLGMHVARANPQWQGLDGCEVLAIFQGAHGYISASWYEQSNLQVPTWDYSAVHCTGIARIAGDRGTHEILVAMVREFEGRAGWSLEGADADSIAQAKRAIVGIRIETTAIEGVRQLLRASI